MRRSDVDQPGRRDPPCQWRDPKSGECGCDDGGDAAADEALAPTDAGFVERANGKRANSAGWGEGCQRQRLAARQGEAPGCEPAELVLSFSPPRRLASRRTITASNRPAS
jgi:hypothetical protein